MYNAISYSIKSVSPPHALSAAPADAVPPLFIRRTNRTGRELIKAFEGFNSRAYQCPSGVWTVGWGHTRTAHEGMTVTREQAEELLNQDLRLAEIAIERTVKVPLNSNQFSALVSFVFNVGITNFARSALCDLLNRGWYEQVPAQLTRWTKSKGEYLGGLARRRAAESKLWRQEETT